MKNKKLILCGLTLYTMNCFGFGPDVCFVDPKQDKNIIKSCIKISKSCRTSNLPKSKLKVCEGVALLNALMSLTGSNGIIAGRSLVHADATYFMAQLIGFTPWEAYQTMIYNMAADRAYYDPYSQQGIAILTPEMTEHCRGTWGKKMPRHCLLLTPLVSGIYKFNPTTGGMLLHWHARFSDDGSSPEPISYPTDYMLPKYQQHEIILNNLKYWVYGNREDACAAGITNDYTAKNAACAPPSAELLSPMSIFTLGVHLKKLSFKTNLGRLVIDEQEDGNIYADNTSLANYIEPNDIEYAKLGIYLHALADRYSHHICIDNSFMYLKSANKYTSKYSSKSCAQGAHMLHHVWEQGTIQTDSNLNPIYQTMRPALESVFEQLFAFAEYKGIKVNKNLDKQQILDQLINVLQIYAPEERLAKMVELIESYDLLSLPKHGSQQNTSIDDWLNLAGAPEFK